MCLKEQVYHIGNYLFTVNCKYEDIKISPPYQAFFITEIPQDKHFFGDIHIKKTQISDTKPAKSVLTATDNNQKYWEIKLHSDKSIEILTANPETFEFPYLSAISTPPFTKWEITMPLINKNQNPFLYPLGELMLYYIATYNQGCLIHGSAVSDNGAGYLFSGVSGKGKSTMAKLWQNTGAKIINDDRILLNIKPQSEDIYMYNTPMFYVQKPLTEKINKLFLIYHSPQNKIEKLSGTKAITGIMSNCIQHNYSIRNIDKLVEFLEKLTKKISVYSLGFVPNTNVVDFIKKNTNV